MRCKRGIVFLVAELKREAEGGDWLLTKESRYLSNLPGKPRIIKCDDLNPECSIGPRRFIGSIQSHCWLSIGTCQI